MIYCNDYFPAGRSDKPYPCGKEHRDDCLRYVSMFLDAFTPDLPDTPAEEFSQAEAHLARREKATKKEGIFLPLLFLTDRLSMTPFQRFLILLALAPETNFQYGYLYAGIQGNPDLTRPSLGLARALFTLRGPVDDAELCQAADETSLFSRVCLASNPDNASAPLIYKSLILNRKTAFFLLGVPYRSPRLAEACRAAGGDFDVCRATDGNVGTGRASSCHPVQYEQLDRLFTSPSDGSPLLVQLAGPPGCGRKHLLSLLARQHGLSLLSIDMRSYLSMEEPESILFCDDLVAELALSNSLLHLDHASFTEEGNVSRLSHLFSRVVSAEPTGSRFVFISTTSQEESSWLSKLSGLFDSSGLPDTSNLRSSSGPPDTSGLPDASGLPDTSGLPDASNLRSSSGPHSSSGLRTFCLEIPLPGADARRILWESFSSSHPLDASVDLDDFALRHLLTPGRIHDALGQADLLRRAEGRETILREHLIRAISASRALSFGVLASKVRLLYTWEDLELPAPQKAILKLACGKGMSLLFYGPPGTGKTMAAQVIARELGMDLYRVDLSQISSKYIGETEKNLNAIFQEAKKADIILFFDEADSLFSKRTDVSNSNDRHANSQTSYILQKIEEYEGVSILATNLSQNFDPAFLRRITFSVRFELPDAPARLRLWQKILPSEAPISGPADFRFLADHFELSGSSIKSILVNAAYLAAGDASAITLSHIVQAMKYEFSKNGRMISDEEFGPYQIYL